MRHANGRPVSVIYEESPLWHIDTHGGIINFNLLSSDGSYIGYTQIEKVASIYNVFLRTGCVCNPGACQKYLNITDDKLKQHFEAGHVCGDTLDLIDNEPTGSVRVSFGCTSTYSDAGRVLRMIRECFVDEPLAMCMKWQTMKEQDVNKFPPISNMPLYSVTTPKDNSIEGSKVLTNIIIYPVKSCAGLSVTNWRLNERGLEYDRHWMIVTSSGITLTQKRMSRMTLIKPSIDLARKVLLLSCEGHESIEVDFDSELDSSVEMDLCGGRVCGDKVKGLDCGKEIGQWISSVLEMDGLKLMRQIKASKRYSKLQSIGHKIGHSLSLANESQFLAVHRPSARMLLNQILMNGREVLDEEDLVLRFRPNLVFDGGEAYDEETWARITIGEHVFEAHGPCIRCQMICVSPETGEKTKEPLLTLASTRGSNMKFGVHLTHFLQDEDGRNSDLSIDMAVSIQK